LWHSFVIVKSFSRDSVQNCPIKKYLNSIQGQIDRKTHRNKTDVYCGRRLWCIIMKREIDVSELDP
jgi:hypothetical protein